MGQPAENFQPAKDNTFVPEGNRSIPVSGPLPDACKSVPIGAGQDEPFLSGRPIFDNPNLPQGGCHLRLISGKSPKGPVQVQGSGAQKPPKPPGAPPAAPEQPEESGSSASVTQNNVEDSTRTAASFAIEQIIASMTPGSGMRQKMEDVIARMRAMEEASRAKLEKSGDEEAKKMVEILRTFVEHFKVQKASPRIVELEAENKKLWDMFLGLTDEVKRLREENSKLKGIA